MSFVTLVRHGQANSDARDDAEYDRLSPLGETQAAWLGAHFEGAGERFARVYVGTLQRQIETAARVVPGASVVTDPRLDEISYFTLAQLTAEQHGHPIPDDREGFVTHLPVMFGLWQAGALQGAPESFEAFETRVTSVLHEIASGSGSALVVTSGGIIGMALRVTLGLDLKGLCHVCLAIQNTSVSRWMPLSTGLALTQFNATPHLDTIERRHAQTHI